LFDLDGTLLQIPQVDFVTAYFAELSKVFTRMGMDAKLSIKALWVGTKAMMLNDGNRTNHERFWTAFGEYLEFGAEKCKSIETVCDGFYANEFDSIKSIMAPNDISKELVRMLTAKRYNLVLATNPIFPLCAAETRLRWLGLELRDFRLVTHYANSTYCKPNPGYYREVFTKIGKAPEQCLMVGNHPVEDMSVGALGTETFLVTDCLENETSVDIAAFRKGTLAELKAYLMSIPVS